MSDADQPPRPDAPEPGSDQLPMEDTLLARGVEDLLDEGYSPPDRPRTNRWGETPLEESLGESLDLRLAQEEPEPWDPEHRAPVGSEEDRTGRLAVDDDEDTDPTGAGSQHLLVDDLGIAGGAASAEEAAMHVIPEDEDDVDDDGAPGDGRTLDDDDLTGTDEDR